MLNISKVFRESPGGAPRDLETIRRSLLRKVVGLDNRSSAPFISGDSFKYLCDFIFEGSAFDLSARLSEITKGNPVVFAQGGPMSTAAVDLAEICRSGYKFPNARLIIHNCDVIPTQEQMMGLVQSFQKVYSVNWLGNPKIVSPLPIGLENRDKRRNGVPSDYSREIRRGLPSLAERDIDFLICFSMHTNQKERNLAFNQSLQLPGTYIVSTPITPRQYRKLVLRSKYVISPSGNGPDCHRTWEAMYLGAIPIVRKEHWPFKHLALPVLQVERWSDIKAYSDLPRNYSSVDWKNLSYWFKK